ncbi:MAG: hypothetical protein ACAI37_09325 [Chthoniobacter sp.]
MKWFSVLSIVALAILANACEKHPVSDAPEEGRTQFGEHSKEHEGHEEKGEAKHGEEAAPSKEAAPAAPEAAKPGEASKIQIFPEKK